MGSILSITLRREGNRHRLLNRFIAHDSVEMLGRSVQEVRGPESTGCSQCEHAMLGKSSLRSVMGPLTASGAVEMTLMAAHVVPRETSDARVGFFRQ